MAERNRADRIEAEDPAQVRRRLAKRMALAAVTIIVLLGALAVFDRMSQPPEEEDEAIEVPRRLPPEVGPSIQNGAPPAAPTPPGPPVEPPPQPEIPARPTAPVEPPAAKPTPTPTPTPPAPTAKPPGKPAPSLPKPPPAVPEGTAPPSQPVAPAPRPSVPRTGLGYLLQAGVFSSHERALELKARLDEAGIPATIESRVHVGPFATKKEAEEARAKMKLLDLEPLLIPPRPAAGR